VHAQLAPLAALLTGAFLLAAAGGLQGLLLPLRAQLDGFPDAAIGGLGAAFAAGFVAGCLLVPRIVAAVGHIRTFAVMASLAAVLVLAMSLAVDAVAWMVLRGATGFCFAGAAMVVESWLNERTTNVNRGAVFATYMVVNLGGVTAGQLSLVAGGVQSHVLFVVAAMLFSLALLPTSLSTRPAPAPVGRVRFDLAQLFRFSPLGATACVAVGAVNGAFATMGPVFLTDAGYGVGAVAVLMSAALVGGTVVQLPLGRLSDRLDRRWVLATTAAGAAGLALLLDGWRPRELATAIPILFLLGGGIYSLYGLAVAHANDRTPPHSFVETAGGLLLLFGIGSVAGPLVASAVMAGLRPGGLLLFMTAVHGALALFALWRILKSAAVPSAEREQFAQVPRNATPGTVALDPRAGESGGAEAVPTQSGGIGQRS
jgi:MFS family permease